jgi:predicted aldo/keto reductase-like oxidoreductase
METRIFGRTGASVSILTMGGCGVGYVDQDEADKAIKLAMDNGINIIDVAPTYGNAEERLHPWISKYRKKFFLAEKTLKRSKKGAWRQLNRSLQKLGTTYFDLYQFHAVNSISELDQILGENGAIEAFKEAKDAGLIKHIGITGHSDMRVLLKALEVSDDFDTVLLPIYAAANAFKDPANDYERVLKLAIEKKMGVTAIKAISKGRWIETANFTTWYEPLTDQETINQAVNFTLSQHGVSTYSLPCDVRLWPLVINAAIDYQELERNQMERIVEIARINNFKPLFPE